MVLAGYRLEDYFSVIAAFDLFVMMRAGSDGTARALREVMAMGKPAIVSDRGMLPELVRDGYNGYVAADERRARRADGAGALRRGFAGKARRKRPEDRASRNGTTGSRRKGSRRSTRGSWRWAKRPGSMAEGARKRPLRVAIVLDRFLPSQGRRALFLLPRGGACAKGGTRSTSSRREAEETNGLPYRVHLIRAGSLPGCAASLRSGASTPPPCAGRRFDVVHGVAQCRAATVLNPHGGVEAAYLRQEFASIENPAYYAYKLASDTSRSATTWRSALQGRLYREGRVRRVIAISRDGQARHRGPLRLSGRAHRRRLQHASTSTAFTRETGTPPRPRRERELGIGEEAILLLFAGNNFRLKGRPDAHEGPRPARPAISRPRPAPARRGQGTARALPGARWRGSASPTG